MHTQNYNNDQMVNNMPTKWIRISFDLNDASAVVWIEEELFEWGEMKRNKINEKNITRDV